MRRFLLPATGLVVLLVFALLLWRPWAGLVEATSSIRTIVLITPDALRRDRVGIYGRNAVTTIPLTPRLDALAREGVLFEDARTPVPLTLPGHTTMLAGLPPAATGVRLNAYGRIPPPATRGFPLLAETLAAANWRTGAFVSAASLLGIHGLDQGFEIYDDDGLDERPASFAFAERPGEETADRALDWIRGLGASERAFLWIHFFEPHAPYAPDLSPTLPTEVRYDVDVARLDRVVAQLLDGLEAAGRGDAVVLVAADHGEALDELGEATHGYLLGDAVLRIPFLLRAPGLVPDRRTDPVDLADVAPTLAALAGVDWPSPTADLPGRGRDLLGAPVPAGRIRVAESLYAHQRYGWAQLLATVGPRGTLVDAGGERLFLLTPAPFLEPQAGPRPQASHPEAAALGRVLSAYRAGERFDLLRGGGVAGGYGSGARVSPFLASQENERLPNPYDVIGRVYALDRLAQALATGASPRDVLSRLERMDEVDPGNPAIAFRRARAWERLADRAPTPTAAANARAQASAGYLEAWQRGRRDANTLGLAVGVDAIGREEACLTLLRDLAAEIPPDGRLALLEARLLRTLGRHEEADEACARAIELCRRPWERTALDRARADETCR